MDHASFMQSLRVRTGQFLTWFIGSTQTQQQYQQSDRQQHDGIVRSLDDPDSRQRQAFGQESGLTLRERFQASAGPQPWLSSGQEQQYRQSLEWQQRAQHARHQQGGWGHGR